MERRNWAGLGLAAVLVVPMHGDGVWRATISGTGGSAVAGTATVGGPGKGAPRPSADTAGGKMAKADLTTATLVLSGGKPKSAVVWFVYDAKCGGGGAVVGGESRYQSLALDDLGAGKGTASIPALADDGSYSVRVHGGSTASDPVVACGDLAKAG